MQKTNVFLKFKKLNEQAVLPQYKTEGAAGMDIRSIECVILQPMEFKIVKTGLACEIPHGYEIQVRPRSGLACTQGLTVINTPGTIDEDYRGEIGVGLINLSGEEKAINIGDRIAQLVVNKVEHVEIIQAETLSSTDRNDGGFGSTGVK